MKTCVSKIIMNLSMTRVCMKFIPKLLTVEQKNFRFEIAQANLEMVTIGNASIHFECCVR